jgi:hypothetical protein
LSVGGSHHRCGSQQEQQQQEAHNACKRQSVSQGKTQRPSNSNGVPIRITLRIALAAVLSPAYQPHEPPNQPPKESKNQPGEGSRGGGVRTVRFDLSQQVGKEDDQQQLRLGRQVQPVVALLEIAAATHQSGGKQQKRRAQRMQAGSVEAERVSKRSPV